ncbi:MAG: V-type ATP synthase subunit D [Bacteroidales bacterium]|nr:V-type ATP synthase subunit D [Bacteroidales bacterium]
MSVRFQYNKTSLQALNKQLKIRQRALPTLKNKESALRMEVKLARERTLKIAGKLESLISDQETNMHMWNEFESSLVSIEEVKLAWKKIAGVKIAELEEVFFHIRDFNIFIKPKWFLEGIQILKEMLKLMIEKELSEKKEEMLEYARKKTTQKVNLYEKVQIPEYEEAIMKIKRFLEDEENLSKAAQKIVKTRQQTKVEAGI